MLTAEVLGNRSAKRNDEFAPGFRKLTAGIRVGVIGRTAFGQTGKRSIASS